MQIFMSVRPQKILSLLVFGVLILIKRKKNILKILASFCKILTNPRPLMYLSSKLGFSKLGFPDLFLLWKKGTKKESH